MEPSAQDLVWWSLISAFGAVGLTTLLRHTPGLSKFVAANKKPLACNVCMPLYTVAAMVAIPVYRTGDWGYAVAFLPAYAGAYALLEQLSLMAPPAIPADLLEEIDDD